MMEQEWLCVDDAAGWLGVPVDVVDAAIKDGVLPALKIGAYTRISRSALLALAGSPAGSVEPPVAVPPKDGAASIPIPMGLSWQEELHQADGFTYRWPRSKDDPDDDGEHYTSVWKGTIVLNGHPMPAVVGEARRYEIGRLTVWLDKYPTAEFAATADGNGWASLIKPDSRKALKLGEPVPPFYRSARVEPYRAVTGRSGSGVVNGLAVVIDRNDLRSAVYHAAARWLARQNLPTMAA